MARGRWKLKRDLAAEQEQIQSAAKKRGLWGSIGGTLLGGLAMAVTGGAASPVVAGLMVGGGKYIGGHLGNLLAGKTSGGKLKGGKFFQGEREALAGQIKENIGAKAAKAAVTAGMAKLPGAALKFGKGGFSATVQKAGGQVGKAGEAVSQYAPGEGGLGKLLDFRGSYIGKGLGKMQAAGAAREAEAAAAAIRDKPLQGGMPDLYGGKIDIEQLKLDQMYDRIVPGARRSAEIAQSERVSEGLKNYDFSQDYVPPTPAEIKDMNLSTLTEKSFETRGDIDTIGMDPTNVFGPTDTYRSQEGLYSTSIPTSEKVSGLSSIEQKYYDKVNQMSDQGYKVGVEGGLPEEYGRGYISKETGDIVRPPSKPDISLPAYEEDLDLIPSTTMDEVTVPSGGPQLTKFDEASWAQGRDRIRDATKQAWWGGGPPTEEALSSESVGIGEFEPDIRTSFPQPNFVKPLGQGTGSRLQRTSDLQKSSEWHRRLFGGNY